MIVETFLVIEDRRTVFADELLTVHLGNGHSWVTGSNVFIESNCAADADLTQIAPAFAMELETVGDLGVLTDKGHVTIAAVERLQTMFKRTMLSKFDVARIFLATPETRVRRFQILFAFATEVC